MNTCCESSPTSLSAATPPPAPSYFSRLQQLVGRARFVSVDLVDNIVMAMPPNRDSGMPHLQHPQSEERPRFMPWRVI
ncbi:MAG: hypothetical protein JWQ62_1129 [Lacunisphaera sp.]|nr:hypothetical protein [Lacunisphaera sp.]